MELNFEFDDLASLHQEAALLVAESPERLFQVVGSVSRWSAAQQIEHALIVNITLFDDIEAALAGRPRITVETGLTRGGELVLGRGAIPRGLAETPEVFRPQPQPPLAGLATSLNEHARALSRLAAARDALRSCSLRIPHFALGGMTPSQWIRFCRIHFAHHLAIAKEVLEQA